MDANILNWMVDIGFMLWAQLVETRFNDNDDDHDLNWKSNFSHEYCNN